MKAGGKWNVDLHSTDYMVLYPRRWYSSFTNMLEKYAASMLRVGDNTVFYPKDGGSRFLWNVGKYLPDYLALHLRRQ
jgi:hypothetical protein